MQRLVGSRLPQFTEEEQSLVQGSVDFFALNHYSTKYAIAVSPQHGDGSVGWVEDQGVDTTNIDRDGSLIGAQAGSPWLNVVPWGFYKVLQFCSERYNNPMIMITENGCDIAGEDNWEMPQALNDSFR
jgi:beta-glucosidase/6-phospho-beta-glucosidase/beta-galactosidase